MSDQDQEMFEVVYNKLKDVEPNAALAGEIVARINDTTDLQIQIRKLWMGLILLKLVVLISVLIWRFG